MAKLIASVRLRAHDYWYYSQSEEFAFRECLEAWPK